MNAQEEVTRHKKIEGKNNISSQFSKICGEAEFQSQKTIRSIKFRPLHQKTN